MNPQQLGKLVAFNSFGGFIATLGLLYLQYAKIPYNVNAWVLLSIAMFGNFGLGLWNWKYRKTLPNKEMKP